ncbi:MAG: NAD(P)-binding domain-containing protein [Bacteroidales bacterium]|nr:NAD(P)-binding domain-containing protein [Bacteroidales bacterium]
MRILITDHVHEVFCEILEKHSFKVNIIKNISYEDLLSLISDFDGLIIRSNIHVDRNVILKAKKLKFIGRLGSGLDNIDVEFANKNKIICLNSPEGNRNSVAEQCIGMLLALLHKITKSNFEVKHNKWNRYENSGFELKGKTVGIIGFGNTGSAFAKKLSSFEVNIIAYDKYKSGFNSFFVKEVNLSDIQKEADIISLHIPLTEETFNFFNKNFINNCKKNFYLINTSRGKIVNTLDLYDALKTGKILGAALDVVEYESYNFKDLEKYPNFFKELINMPNVIITPHTCGLSDNSLYNMSLVLANKIVNIFGKN